MGKRPDILKEKHNNLDRDGNKVEIKKVFKQKTKGEVMGQMSWLAYLVDTEDKKELVKFLAGKGFKNPEFAAKEFLKAGEDLKKEKVIKEIKKTTALINAASVGIRDE